MVCLRIENMAPKKIVKNGKEYKYEEKTLEKDTVLNVYIPDPSVGIDDKTFEKYRNSPEWKELDDLYLRAIAGEGNTKEILQKIVSYGEIARAKHRDFFNLMKEGDKGSIDLMLLPYFLRMPVPHAIDFLERRYSDNEETSIRASIEINELIKDEYAHSLMEIIKNAGNVGDREVTNGAMGELCRMGEIALPSLRLEIVNTKDPQYQLDLSIVALIIILGDENEAIKMVKQISNLNDEFSDSANKKFIDLLNEIDLRPYFLRHPEKVEELVKSQ